MTVDIISRSISVGPDWDRTYDRWIRSQTSTLPSALHNSICTYTVFMSISIYYTLRKLCLWWVYCFHGDRACVRVCVRPCIRPSVTFCFLNILKSHCWIFIKPCKHVHICKTNILSKKVRTRGQFY